MDLIDFVFSFVILTPFFFALIMFAVFWPRKTGSNDYAGIEKIYTPSPAPPPSRYSIVADDQAERARQADQRRQRKEESRRRRITGGELIHTDEFGALWRVQGQRGPEYYVQVRDPQENKRGGHDTITLGVAPEIRPTTALQAVASTFGQTAEEYRSVQES